MNYSLADATKTDVFFHLFTGETDTGIYLDENNVNHFQINTHLPTKFLIHGWLSNETTYWYRPYRDEVLKTGNHNIFFIDWSKAGSKSYEVSAANTKPAGNFIGDFIVASGIDLNKVHIIGHSLGSHVAGFTGKRIYELTGLKLGRITGTDPAGMSFEHADVSEEDRIAKTDAQFVDIIHTDIGHYGFIKPIGSADFYPNGGTFQPGCPPYEVDGKFNGFSMVGGYHKVFINL